MKKIKSRTGSILLLFFIVSLFGCENEPLTNTVVSQVTISQPAITLDPGQSQQLEAVVTPGDAGNTAVAWSSRSERIASVAEGLITAHAPGTTTVLATAYSNADAYGEVTVVVTGIPEDLAAAVEGVYIGDVTMGGMAIATDVEATLTAADNKVRLATDASTPLGSLSMDIEVDVQREGEGYRISGTGVSSFGAVSVDGPIDAEGLMTLTISLPDAGVEVIFTARKGQTSLEAVAGTYLGVVDIPMMGAIPDVELTLTPDGTSVILATSVTTPIGQLEMTVPMSVARAGSDYSISGTGTTELLGPVEITGTVSAAGAIDLTIHVANMGIDVSYVGQRLRNPATVVAGTYIGAVTAQGMGPITGNDVAMVLTEVDPTTVHWATQTSTPMGDFAVSDFPLTVARSGSDFTLAGSGTSSVGPLEVTGTIDAAGHVVVTMTGPALLTIIIYEGQKQ